MENIANYIAGKLQAPVSNNYIDNFDPSTGKVYSQIPDSDEQDVKLATEAAQKAFPLWSVMSAEARSGFLLKLADLIDRDLESLALAESKDNGKPVWLAKLVDIPRASSNFRFFATAILHWADEAHNTDGKAINYTLHQPLGVAGCISPWNLPLYLFSWKIAPALASGNCVVAKPSEITPYTAYALSKLCIEAGMPAGVLNIVHGLGPKVGAAIVSHPDIPAISFTGGTATGKHIASVAAPMFKKLSLELGGKNANLVFADADIDKAVELSVKAAFSNQGQICLCGSRILIEESIYNEFRDKFVKAVEGLKLGPPNLDDSRVGALVSQAHMEKVLEAIELAKSEGGLILTGGSRTVLDGEYKDGYYVKPTVIEGLGSACRTNQEEIFGPVVTLIPFTNEEDAVNQANSTRYGLSAVIQTNDVSRAHRVSANLHAGIIWVNTWLFRDLRTPFGGMKQSGVGREGGYEALKFFTEAKNVCVKI